MPNPQSLAQTSSPNASFNPISDLAEQALAPLVATMDAGVMRPGLDRMHTVLEKLCNPQNTVPVIHISGTNGKGSVAVMLASCLKAAGYKVGLTTSPHLSSVRERIAINSEPVDLATWQAGCQALAPIIQTMAEKPTYFEAIILLAFWVFAQAHKNNKLDLAIVETGLGGRLDATNVVSEPLLTIITSIGLDHTDVLGDSLADIATEKAGIIKPCCPVVLGPHLSPPALEAINTIAGQRQAPVTISKNHLSLSQTTLTGQCLTTNQGLLLTLPLHGAHQQANLSTVLTAIKTLCNNGWEVSDKAIQAGIQNTHWPLRCEVHPQQRVILDGSHNLPGWQSLIATIKTLPTQADQWGLVLCVKTTKDITGLGQCLAQLPLERIWLTTGLDNPTTYHPPTALAPMLITAGVPEDAITLCPPDVTMDSLARWIRQSPAGWGLVTGSLTGVASLTAHLDRG